MTAAERPDAGEGLVESERDVLTERLYADLVEWTHDLGEAETAMQAIEAAVERIIAARETAAAEAVVGRVEALGLDCINNPAAGACIVPPEKWCLPCRTRAALRAGDEHPKP